jgi:hypothetical protein
MGKKVAVAPMSNPVVGPALRECKCWHHYVGVWSLTFLFLSCRMFPHRKREGNRGGPRQKWLKLTSVSWVFRLTPLIKIQNLLVYLCYLVRNQDNGGRKISTSLEIFFFSHFLFSPLKTLGNWPTFLFPLNSTEAALLQSRVVTFRFFALCVSGWLSQLLKKKMSCKRHLLKLL